MIRLFAGAPDDEAWRATIARTAERLAALGERGRTRRHDRLGATQSIPAGMT